MAAKDYLEHQRHRDLEPCGISPSWPGVSPPTVYAHFATVDDLVAAFFQWLGPRLGLQKPTAAARRLRRTAEGVLSELRGLRRAVAQPHEQALVGPPTRAQSAEPTPWPLDRRGRRSLARSGARTTPARRHGHLRLLVADGVALADGHLRLHPQQRPSRSRPGRSTRWSKPSNAIASGLADTTPRTSLQQRPVARSASDDPPFLHSRPRSGGSRTGAGRTDRRPRLSLSRPAAWRGHGGKRRSPRHDDRDLSRNRGDGAGRGRRACRLSAKRLPAVPPDLTPPSMRFCRSRTTAPPSNASAKRRAGAPGSSAAPRRACRRSSMSSKCGSRTASCSRWCRPT